MITACPDCGTDTVVHDPSCGFTGTEPREIRGTYFVVISALSYRGVCDPDGRVTFDDLRDSVDEISDGTLGWTPLHEACFHELKRRRWVEENDTGIRLTEITERRGELVPTYEPMQTVYEYGPVDGAKDNAVYAIVSWCEMHDLDWDQTTAFVERWLHETGGWERGTWSEDSIADLLAGKRHVHRRGLGWLTRAEAAQHAIQQSDVDPALDANADAGTIDAGTL